MRWSKTHQTARFELTSSGLAPVDLGSFGGDSVAVSLRNCDNYGHPELTAQIAQLRGVGQEQVLPVLGTSMANVVALACAASPGDSILFEHPIYDPLLRAANFLGMKPVFFDRPASQEFSPDLEQVRMGFEDGARALVLSNLHNPTGQLCREDCLRSLAGLSESAGAIMIVDEVYLDYARLNVAGTPLRGSDLGQHVVVTDSLTKVYGLGPIRAGWLIAQPKFIHQAGNALDVLNVNNPPTSTLMAVRAMEQLDRLNEICQQQYQAVLPVLSNWLASRPDIRSYPQCGALFACIGMPPGIGADELAELLNRKFETNVVSCRFFGLPDHIRVGLANPPDYLAEGLNRVSEALDLLNRRLTS